MPLFMFMFILLLSFNLEYSYYCIETYTLASKDWIKLILRFIFVYFVLPKGKYRKAKPSYSGPPSVTTFKHTETYLRLDTVSRFFFIFSLVFFIKTTTSMDLILNILNKIFGEKSWKFLDIDYQVLENHVSML